MNCSISELFMLKINFFQIKLSNQIAENQLYFILMQRRTHNQASSRNFHHHSPSKSRDFRHSMDFINNERFRNTIGFDYNPSPTYRQTVETANRFRNSLDMNMAFDFIEHISMAKQSQNSSYSKLKNTLSDLEVKLSKAKKELSNKGNVLQGFLDDKSDEQFSIGEMIESTIKIKNQKGVYTVMSPRMNQGKFNTDSAKTFPSMTVSSPHINKIKTYYLQQIVKAMSGQSKQGYQHLNISLKVIRSLPNFQPLSFMEIQDRKVNLPKQKDDKRKTLVIDIDETIIHCQQQESHPHDLVLPIKLQNGQYANAYIAIRPYAISFLKKMSKSFEIIAFTASHQSYADVVLDQIDPDREYIKHRLYRDHCFEIHPNIFTKDLRVINRDLSQMVLVDNAPYSYIFQLQNGIPIIPFYKGEDYQLPKLEKYLEEVAKCKDVRELNKNTFKLHQYSKFTSNEQLAKTLYFNIKK